MKALILLGLLALQGNAEQMGHRDGATPTASSPIDVIKDYVNQLMAQMKPFGVGVLSGASLAALETKLIDPALAGFDDKLALAMESAGLAGVGYAAYENRDSDIVQEYKKPATILGFFAGLFAYCKYMGEGLGI